MTTRTAGTRPQAGFTLLEVLLAITIMGMVMVGLYTTLNRTLDTRDMLSREVRAARLGPDILDRMEADLRGLWAANLKDDVVFQGEQRTLLGESADTMTFVAATGSQGVVRVGDDAARTRLVETGYRLRPNPDVPDVLELWRRESLHVDDEPLEDGTYERIHDRVIALEIRYFEDRIEAHEEFEEWEAEERHALPAMVSISLGIEVGPRRLEGERRSNADDDRTRWYRRLIVLDTDNALTMRVKPYPPAFTGFADGSAGSGTADGQQGQDGEGGDEDGGEGDGGGPDDGSGGSSNLDELLEGIFGGGG